MEVDHDPAFPPIHVIAAHPVFDLAIAPRRFRLVAARRVLKLRYLAVSRPASDTRPDVRLPPLLHRSEN
jgi:hypothetical protein